MGNATDEPIFEYSRAYLEQLPPYFRIDLNVNVKQNFRKVSLEVYFEAVNLTNRKNIWMQYYDTNKGEYEYINHYGFMPMGGFRFYF